MMIVLPQSGQEGSYKFGAIHNVARPSARWAGLQGQQVGTERYEIKAIYLHDAVSRRIRSAGGSHRVPRRS